MALIPLNAYLVLHYLIQLSKISVTDLFLNNVLYQYGIYALLSITLKSDLITILKFHSNNEDIVISALL